MTLEDIIANDLVVQLHQLKSDPELVKQIQKKLTVLHLYPGSRAIDGKYGSRTEAALVKFCNAANLDNMKTGRFNRAFAEALINISEATFLLEAARDREQVFSDFYQQESGFSAEKLAFLDRGIATSPYKGEIDFYPSRLKEKPDDREVICFGETATVSKSSKPVKFNHYPKLGELPQIDDQGLNFLHEDIQQACICIGSSVGGIRKAHWLGKNALDNEQFWSTTKILPILNVVDKVNAQFPYCDIDDCVVTNPDTGASFPFHELAVDVHTYKEKIGTSNSISAMFKRFETFAGLDSWVKNITGNNDLEFRGTYGEPPFINSPQLFDQKSQQLLLTAAPETDRGSNSVSAYDLTRFVTMLGWHYHLTQPARLPFAQWDSLESVVRAMGNDIARYVDVAIAKLGLQSVIKSPVILSKMGFGRSDARNQTELAYVALVQFIDRRPRTEGKPSKLRTLAMALRAVKSLGDPNLEAIEIDARMAAEVTEIIRRVVTEELV